MNGHDRKVAQFGLACGIRLLQSESIVNIRKRVKLQKK